jgi:hypothetical protein
MQWIEIEEKRGWWPSGATMHIGDSHTALQLSWSRKATRGHIFYASASTFYTFVVKERSRQDYGVKRWMLPYPIRKHILFAKKSAE